jgi:hypothetical protein
MTANPARPFHIAINSYFSYLSYHERMEHARRLFLPSFPRRSVASVISVWSAKRQRRPRPAVPLQLLCDRGGSPPQKKRGGEPEGSPPQSV